MRQHLDIARGLIGRIAPAVVIAVVTVACCQARTAAPSPVEAGYPSDLINTPVCAAIENFDDARDCRTTGWPEAEAAGIARSDDRRQQGGSARSRCQGGRPVIAELRASGTESLQAIAAGLNER